MIASEIKNYFDNLLLGVDCEDCEFQEQCEKLNKLASTESASLCSLIVHPEDYK